ncbi:hypothetical protein K502DRAFT_348244 [Neoconidiobolus thromboides FSU 785]|nr:hypothetical protein K502DRAFT_348244 [Neoconidiobolus thromboides FSU 785]
MSIGRVIKYYALEYPVYFTSLALAAVGPIAVVTVPSFRRNVLGHKKPADIPTSYPLPKHARSFPSGYED